jgi:hypothetical protein
VECKEKELEKEKDTQKGKHPFVGAMMGGFTYPLIGVILRGFPCPKEPLKGNVKRRMIEMLRCSP